jgi:hypothetical protein
MFKPDGLAGMWQDAATWLRRARERGAAAPPAGQ